MCGKLVYRKKYTLDKYDIFFCSWECEKKHQSISRRVSELPESWRSRSEYKTWRKRVLDRDLHTCKICGSKKNPVAHHIIEAQDSPDLRYDIDNGITLCKKCHIAIHVKDSHRFIESLQEAILVE
jgi:5-methylcytosine-specific restriction endonuclease McrA